ncbi:MATE family efflux transporter [Algivirga pacifica]|uniref:MATE family efflux transporter n=1 Tax=Algivirga pacifica TaxID=1162670 RepID=A0ABP9DA69_9BACT
MEARTLLLKDSIWRLFFKLSIPSIITTVTVALNLIIDSAFIGHMIGQAGVVALISVFTFNYLVFALEGLVAVATATFMSHAYGKGDKEGQQQAYRMQNTAVIFLGGIALVLSLVFIETYLELSITHLSSKPLALEYLSGYVFCIPFRIYAFSSSRIMQMKGLENAITKHYLVGMLLNLIGTPVLIILMGMKGGAIATVLAEGGVVLLNYWCLKQKDPLFSSRLGGWNTHPYGYFLKNGLAAIAMQLLFFVQFTLIFRAMRGVGSDVDMAVLGTSIRYLLFMVYVAVGFSRAMQPVVGVNFGGQQYHRVIKALKIFTFGGSLFLLLLWSIGVLFSTPLLWLSLPELISYEVHEVYFLILWSIVLLSTFLMTGMSYLETIGKAPLAALLALLRVFLFLVPFLWILPEKLGVSGVYWSVTLMDLCSVLVLMYLLRKPLFQRAFI